MYNPEEDIISPEILAQALAISNVPVTYKTYFDKDDGTLLAISNEDLSQYSNSVELEYHIIRDFLTGACQLSKYKIIFVDQTTPKIVPISDTDVGISLIDKVPVVNDWDSMFTIENYPSKRQWGFHLRQDQKSILMQHNLNTSFEVFVVDKDNHNFLFRTIKLQLGDLLTDTRVYMPYESNKESDTSNITIFVKKFFETTGYQILYDTNS